MTASGHQTEAQPQEPQQARLGQEEALGRRRTIRRHGRVLVVAAGGRRGEGEAALRGHPLAGEQEKVILSDNTRPRDKGEHDFRICVASTVNVALEVISSKIV